MSGNETPLGYPTREVARLLEVSPATVRSYVRAGLVTPGRDRGGGFRFAFQDLVVLRVARGLAAERLPPRRVRAALARLREQLPAGRSLSAVRLAAEGGAVVARSGGEGWEPASGQRLLDFEAAAGAGPEAPNPAATLRHVPSSGASAFTAAETRQAEEWYELACELEAADPAGARDAYRRVLDLDPGHADAHLNLGRLLHESGDPAAAERCYRAAVALRPDDAVAAFNLGVALGDLDRSGEAVDAYRSAIEADPACADAYFNLAQLYADLGQRAAAIRSLKVYKSLVEGPG
jgi:tetratricopeptide (TPR) repeat protein